LVDPFFSPEEALDFSPPWKVERFSLIPGRGNGRKMRKKKLFGIIIFLLFLSFPGPPLEAQTLSEVFVSPTGNVLGVLFDFNPGFPSAIFISAGGLLVWVEMEIPKALIEIYPDGYVRLIQATSCLGTSFTESPINKIGDVPFGYDSNGRVSKIGG
jgi:hypothetical protein